MVDKNNKSYMSLALWFTIEATQIRVVKWKKNMSYVNIQEKSTIALELELKSTQHALGWIGNCRIESLLTCILAVDEEILVVVLVVAAAESSGCAHLEDVRVGSLIVQAVQTTIKSLDRFIIQNEMEHIALLTHQIQQPIPKL